jgi:hypothetical protein
MRLTRRPRHSLRSRLLGLAAAGAISIAIMSVLGGGARGNGYGFLDTEGQIAQFTANTGTVNSSEADIIANSTAAVRIAVGELVVPKGSTVRLAKLVSYVVKNGRYSVLLQSYILLQRELIQY